MSKINPYESPRPPETDNSTEPQEETPEDTSRNWLFAALLITGFVPFLGFSDEYFPVVIWPVYFAIIFCMWKVFDAVKTNASR